MNTHQVDTALGRLRVRSRGSGETIVFWPSVTTPVLENPSLVNALIGEFVFGA